VGIAARAIFGTPILGARDGIAGSAGEPTLSQSVIEQAASVLQ
jgi:hypothetical protein